MTYASSSSSSSPSLKSSSSSSSSSSSWWPHIWIHLDHLVEQHNSTERSETTSHYDWLCGHVRTEAGKTEPTDRRFRNGHVTMHLASSRSLWSPHCSDTCRCPLLGKERGPWVEGNSIVVVLLFCFIIIILSHSNIQQWTQWWWWSSKSSLFKKKDKHEHDQDNSLII